MKILVAINNLASVSQLTYSNHNQWWYRLGKQYGDSLEFGLCNPRRMSIDRMRNFAARAALELSFDYLLFIDDDVLLPFNTVERLLKADKDICAGVTLIRGYPYHPMIFDFMGPQLAADGRTHYVDRYAELADPKTGLLECDAVGFSCCLIKSQVLRDLKPPFFLTFDGQCTEDIYFCNKAKIERPGTRVFVDTGILTAHILGDDIIEPENLLARRSFDESLDPNLKSRTQLSESRQPLVDPKVIRTVDYSSYIQKEIWQK